MGIPVLKLIPKRGRKVAWVVNVWVLRAAPECASGQGHFQMLGHSILELAGHCAPWSWGAVGMLAREGRCFSEEKLHCHTAPRQCHLVALL